MTNALDETVMLRGFLSHGHVLIDTPTAELQTVTISDYEPATKQYLDGFDESIELPPNWQAWANPHEIVEPDRRYRGVRRRPRASLREHLPAILAALGLAGSLILMSCSLAVQVVEPLAANSVARGLSIPALLLAGFYMGFGFRR